MSEKVERPWGYYENLSEDSTHKVKRLTVYPEKRLSLQKHKYRSETWVVASGNGTAEIDTLYYDLWPGKIVEIPKASIHRLINKSNKENLVVVEVQLGEILSEEDIVRLEDDFGRA